MKKKQHRFIAIICFKANFAELNNRCNLDFTALSANGDGNKKKNVCFLYNEYA